MCKIQKNSYFQTRSERLIIIQIKECLTIIPRAHEAEGQVAYLPRGNEMGERNNCFRSFSKIQLVGQKYRDKTTLASKTLQSSVNNLYSIGAITHTSTNYSYIPWHIP